MLILVRHGRTAANAAGLLQGRLDLPLDPVGRRQAEAAARFVGEVDAVISSPLTRAVETAEAFGVAIELDPRWLELDYGEYDGIASRDLTTEVWTRWKGDAAFRPPGGESLNELELRVHEACAQLVERAASQDIVVVSHVSPIKAAVAWALDVGIGVSWRCHLAQASICRIVMRAEGPVLLTFNETADATQ